MSRPNNPLGLAVLTYLTQRPMHAYELHKMLQERDAAKTFQLSYGAVYSVVRQLERGELITAARVGQTGRLPKHTVYEITDRGTGEMRAWLGELLGKPAHEHQSFVAALSLMAVLPPAEVIALLRQRDDALGEAIGVQQAVREKSLRSGVHPLFLVEDEYRIAQLTTERTFIDGLVKRIENGWSADWQAALDNAAETLRTRP